MGSTSTLTLKKIQKLALREYSTLALNSFKVLYTISHLSPTPTLPKTESNKLVFMILSFMTLLCAALRTGLVDQRITEFSLSEFKLGQLRRLELLTSIEGKQGRAVELH